MSPKLTIYDITEILDMSRRGIAVKHIAKDFGVSRAEILRILRQNIKSPERALPVDAYLRSERYEDAHSYEDNHTVRDVDDDGTPDELCFDP